MTLNEFKETFEAEINRCIDKTGGDTMIYYGSFPEVNRCTEEEITISDLCVNGIALHICIDCEGKPYITFNVD